MAADEQQQRVARVFNRVAEGYDHPALRLFPFCADVLAERLPLRPGQKALDVATGTGAVAGALAQRLGAAGRVIAIDLAEAMLEQAQQKLGRLGLANVDFHLMDAQALEFRRGYFDHLSCGFGLFFLPDMAGALAQWRRVLKPGGWAAFTAFGPGAFQPMKDLFLRRLEDHGIAPENGPGTDAVQRLADPENGVRLLEQAGFVEVEVMTRQMGYHLADAGQWWEVIWNAGYRGLVDRLSPAQLARFRPDHLAEVAALAGEEGLWMDVEVHFFRGRKPAGG